MALKQYQERVVDEMRTYLREVAQQTGRYPSRDAWEAMGLGDRYRRRANALGNDVPNFCLKVPTGGGKTLLATQALALIYETILSGRNGSGLALWIVPSDQIYKDTLKALKDRGHFYRESLDFAFNNRIEVWEKHEIARLTPAQLASRLNILLFKLPAANRQVKATLKMFQDSGGNIVRHFPREDDEDAHRELRAQVPNLEVIPDTDLIKTSVGNLVRLCQPPVILDEGHKAYSPLAQQTMDGLNPAIIVELSATPNEERSNVLCRVSGEDLLKEHMVKLPVNVAVNTALDWRRCLEHTQQKRDELERLARQYHADTERWIRPIVLVQVERVGKDQRDGKHVHSLDVRDYLTQRAGVPESNIAIKTSVRDDIEGRDLLDEGCEIRYIITKAALQEGWDCPFAYLLVSLSRTQSRLAMTQLLGRILRQPYQEPTTVAALNESYVFCVHDKTKQVTQEVKGALEKEGYEGDAQTLIRDGDGRQQKVQTATIRPQFRRLYKEFQGKIYLPRFCIKENGKLHALHYYEHLLSAVDIHKFPSQEADWTLDLREARQAFYRVDLGSDPAKIREEALSVADTDDDVRNWLVGNLNFNHFSQKQLRTVVTRYLDALLKKRAELVGNLRLIKYPLRDKVREFIEVNTDQQTQQAFQQLHDTKRLGFFMYCVECRFEIPRSVEIAVTKKLSRDDGEEIRKSLFDREDESHFNKLERKVALCFDEHPEILWWYRNLVGKECFVIDGFQRARIYPDFVVATNASLPIVHVVEAKGGHLKGNPDTDYKRGVGTYFDQLGKAVLWSELGEGFEGHRFRFHVVDETKYDHGWQEALRKLLRDGQGN